MAISLPGPRTVFDWAVRTTTTVVSVPGRMLDLLAATEEVVRRANELVDRTEAVVASAEEAVEHARSVTTAADEIVQASKPLLRFVTELSAHELEAAIKLVDELPKLSEHMTKDIMPILGTLDRVGPDIHELLDVTKDVRKAILGIPGFAYLRKRGNGRDLER